MESSGPNDTFGMSEVEMWTYLVDDDEFRVSFDREFGKGTRDWNLAAFAWLQLCGLHSESARMLALKRTVEHIRAVLLGISSSNEGYSKQISVFRAEL